MENKGGREMKETKISGIWIYSRSGLSYCFGEYPTYSEAYDMLRHLKQTWESGEDQFLITESVVVPFKNIESIKIIDKIVEIQEGEEE